MLKRYLYRQYRSYTAIAHRLERRVTRTGWLLVFATVIAALMGVDTSASVAYQTFSLLFCLLCVAVASTWFWRGRIGVERILPRIGSAGQPLKYRMLLRNQTRQWQRNIGVLEQLPDPRPSLAEFLNTPEPGEEKRNWVDRQQGWYRWQWLVQRNTRAVVSDTDAPPIPPQRSVEVEVQILPTRRGVLRLNSVVLACPDPLGLFRALRPVAVPQSVLILPRRYPIPPVQLPGISKYQKGGVALAGSVGESEEFVSLRDYRPGDPLRRIHWRSFARAGRPVVKEFQDEFFVRHALILDTFGVPRHSDVFEEAVSVAASFACAMQTQDSLLDLMFVGPEAYCFTAGRGVGHTEQMLEILASVQPTTEANFEELEQLVLRHSGAVSGCVCVFLGWDEPRRRLVSKLRALEIPLWVFVVAEKDEPLDAGPLAGAPETFHVLPLGTIAEKLALLGARRGPAAPQPALTR